MFRTQKCRGRPFVSTAATVDFIVISVNLFLLFPLMFRTLSMVRKSLPTFRTLLMFRKSKLKGSQVGSVTGERVLCVQSRLAKDTIEKRQSNKEKEKKEEKEEKKEEREKKEEKNLTTREKMTENEEKGTFTTGRNMKTREDCCVSRVRDERSVNAPPDFLSGMQSTPSSKRLQILCWDICRSPPALLNS